jgi:GNAT superfamily N-acetyltransferase
MQTRQKISIAIRTGLDEDWEAMRDTFTHAGRAAWNHILPEATLGDLCAPERWRPRAGADVLVAEHADKVVGFVCLRASADGDAGPTVGEVDACYAHPSVWGRGVGQVLLAAAVAHLAGAGFEEATLWTEQRNHRPLRFYRAAGWRPDGTERRRTYAGTDLLELRLRRFLL